MLKLDATDIKILEITQQDARITTKALADKLNLSTTPVFERVKRLEREGLIKKYVALVDNKKLGLRLIVFISISLTKHSRAYLEKFVEEVSQYPEVMECYHIAGNFDFLLKVVVKSMEVYEAFVLNKLSTIANLGQVQSSFVLSENIHTTAYKV
ncbi:Lrp/AsnC family leucine-responsive transcriptional regulator/Lrp/AsnC family transcriptional regulator [Roseivirga pacifica]|uniref:Lrp/AsnC family transcriptional regulator, leucine-responsive regulatory protein/Lrp/AsnC family transcriptional regulator n=1 Tax=Roseivirga pacifica TaxID=1267423 RepID=A0A1I0RMT0_9BACT|nr:Lrp/AsnC family transcriptional regulator [Roseivirga pacifica]MCO6358340.1 winged helix-turn-helix transcriptional regulator [Roseivirga pacifica]MCO6366196.1 winged helix-turn-helix transcriptional regulator [Roseivirga pacifica]MCO6369253.1 winged helix-turn-helix transcriptional regulator [Roseivirga pacifica]MCO6374071.1 winged helix-turn-helix transcriptional regulator [Roseivirga pacifica]MCO6378447.1 winged helix-turn-helix transcriptional regulator [Roseivirga pacifica]